MYAENFLAQRLELPLLFLLQGIVEIFRSLDLFCYDQRFVYSAIIEPLRDSAAHLCLLITAVSHSIAIRKPVQLFKQA